MELNQYTVISTFAGCGGSSLGYKWAGFKELLAIDFEKNAVETFALNFPEVPVWQKDIKTVTAQEILEFCKIAVGELDVLDGSPPCQGFSTSGKRVVTDERNDLFKEYVRLIDGLQPKVFVMENVSGMVKGKMKGKFIEIMKTLKSLNYQVKCKLMNAKYYNVPQSRERLIFIGVRNDVYHSGMVDVSFPKGNKKIVSIQDVLPELKGLKVNYSMYPGLTLEGLRPWHTTKEPSPTITKSNKMVFYDCGKMRCLKINEALILTSFPNNFKLIGAESDQISRIGNSVPPKFMQAIAENIKTNMLDKYYLNL